MIFRINDFPPPTDVLPRPFILRLSSAFSEDKKTYLKAKCDFLSFINNSIWHQLLTVCRRYVDLKKSSTIVNKNIDDDSYEKLDFQDIFDDPSTVLEY